MCDLIWEDRKTIDNNGQLIRHVSQFVPSSGRFKIGITSSPQNRASKYRGQYEEMVVVHRTETALEARLSERALINNLSHSDNIDPGGGGPLGSRPYYVYIVRGTPKRSSRSDSMSFELRLRDSTGAEFTLDPDTYDIEPTKSNGLPVHTVERLVARRSKRREALERAREKEKEKRRRQEEAEVVADAVTGFLEMVVDLFDGSRSKQPPAGSTESQAAPSISAATAPTSSQSCERPHRSPRKVSWRVERLDDARHKTWNITARTPGEAADKLRELCGVDSIFMDTRRTDDALYVNFTSPQCAKSYVIKTPK